MRKINPQIIKLVSILSDGKTHDGEELGKSLKVSRAAIWKMIAKLKNYGIEIESTKGLGYTLLSKISLLNCAEIAHAFINTNIHVACFESIDSTNDYFKNKPFIDENRLEICLAENQTKGRGRLNRSWYSPFGQNLYLSCRYFFRKDMSELGGLSLVIGLSIVEALKKLGALDIALKWPNDVLWQHKKLAGVLVEVRAEAYGLSEVVIGIGMNVNMTPDNIQQKVVSLSEIFNQLVNRTELAIALIKQIAIDLVLFKEGGWQVFVERFNSVDHLQHKEIKLLIGNKEIAGMVAGVNHQGYLLLQDKAGNIKSFSSGEASVAKE